ncbi:MAG TPA: Maf family protein [Planctomycetota bacterium]|nr:Maf family protein [Planctomycetota bacterium]
MLILASGSPRRRALLENAGIAFRVVVPDVPEDEPERGDPHAVARTNARRKAEAVAGDLVLAADTVVAVGDRLLGKPRDEADAADLLRALSGTTHVVVTAVALKAGGRIRERAVTTRVTMRRLDEDEIRAYAASGEGMGKAGAYAIQETADRFVTALDGPFDNVVGLPVDAVKELLRAAGVDFKG